MFRPNRLPLSYLRDFPLAFIVAIAYDLRQHINIFFSILLKSDCFLINYNIIIDILTSDYSITYIFIYVVTILLYLSLSLSQSLVIKAGER